jgi:transposase-like protein
MSKTKRVKRSETTWRELFSRQAASGVPASEFCRREGINAGLFRRWRAALSSPKRAEKSKVSKPVTAAGAPFIDLGALSSSPGGARFEVRLELGGGVTLSVARG